MPDIFLSPGDSRRHQPVSLGNSIIDAAIPGVVMATAALPDADHKRHRDTNRPTQQWLELRGY